jgi:hypothetical protein
MKKYAILFLIALFVTTAAESASARAIGGKVIYNNMMDNYHDYDFENNLSGGIFFETGPSFFDSRFRPGFDWVNLENDYYKETVYAVHFDFYWFFLRGKALTPFVGFGPAFNYRHYNAHYTDDDSDAGIEAFAGLEFNLSGPWSLIGEFRLAQHDIADWGDRIFKTSIGIVYYF